VRGPEQARAERLAERWTQALRKHAGPVEIMGPEPAFIQRVKKQHRYRTILKARGQSHRVLQQALRRTKEEFSSVPNGYHVSIDVDALGLL